MGFSEEIIGKDRCPTPVAAMASVWLALLVGAGANAAWLFHTLMKADVQFRGAGASTVDAAETGRILAGVLAQPAFLVVFGFGLLAGPLCAWMLVRQSKELSAMAAHLRLAAILLLLAGLAGVPQLLLARRIAAQAVDRTEAMVSGDTAGADQARTRLDRLHGWSERVYAGQAIAVTLGMAVMLKPASRRDLGAGR